MNDQPLHADKIMAYLNQAKTEEPSLANAVQLAQIMAESMQAFLKNMDATVYQELRSIAGYIENMKQEIGAFQVNELKESRIPAAGMELDAVVQSTENATNTIMECAEELLAAEHDNLDDYRNFVTDKVMQIFEACSFQDLTGQRVNKVVETLQMIESRVGRFAKAVQAQDMTEFVNEHESKREKRKADLLLNGPALEGEGIDQHQVDSLLNAPGTRQSS